MSQVINDWGKTERCRYMVFEEDLSLGETKRLCAKRADKICVGRDHYNCGMVTEKIGGLEVRRLPTDEEVRGRMDDCAILLNECLDFGDKMYLDMANCYRQGIETTVAALSTDDILRNSLMRMIDTYAYWSECAGVYHGLVEMEETECENS